MVSSLWTGWRRMKRAADDAVSAYLDGERRVLAHVSRVVDRGVLLARVAARALARAMGIWP